MVNILKEIYNEILTGTVIVPPETGGIIGCRDGVITDFFRDNGIGAFNTRYYPDINKLNSKIKKWADKDIMFCGVYHSHHNDDLLLSKADTEYISCILSVCSDYTDELYFPLVFPGKDIIFFSAKLNNGLVVINNEEKNIL